MASLVIARACMRSTVIHRLVDTKYIHHKIQVKLLPSLRVNRTQYAPSRTNTNGPSWNNKERSNRFTILGTAGGICAICLAYAYYFAQPRSIWDLKPVTKASASSGGLEGPPSRRFNFIADVVEKTAPAVVYIELKERHPFISKLSATSNGSGFIVRSDGLILTNAHVVANKTHVSIRLHSGKEMEGFVIAVDPISDLCAIRIDATNLPTVSMGNSSTLRAGEWVIAMGSPLSLSNTVTSGIVSSTQRRSIELGIQNKDMDYIQTDAVINFGNSGGPLINLDGEVIGINTMKVTPGISFAIPIDYAKTFLQAVDELLKRGETKTRIWLGMGKETKRRRYMGITMLTLSPSLLLELRNRVTDFPEIAGGVLVHKLIVGSPAYRAGIQAGDIIVEINGNSTVSSSDVYKAVDSTEFLRVTVLRGNQKLTFDVTTEMVS